MSPTASVSSLLRWALATGVLVVVALLALYLALRDDESKDGLLGEATPRTEMVIYPDAGNATIWASASDLSSDPRAGSKPDPGACKISSGEGEISAPEETGTGTLDETTLYPIGQLTDYEPPVTLSCDGPYEFVYVGNF